MIEGFGLHLNANALKISKNLKNINMNVRKKEENNSLKG